jgi:ribosomal protein S14
MNYTKDHLFARDRVGYRFRALVDRTIREQTRKERRLAEQRATKHQFQARNSCILDGRNYRSAPRLLLLARAQF